MLLDGKSVRTALHEWIGHLLCRVGLHDFRLLEIVGGFGGGGTVQKVECRRCGRVRTRRG